MNKQQKMKTVETLAISLDMAGQDMSESAMNMMTDELSAYDFDAVQQAIRRTVRECKYRISLAEIISRIDDGRPTADEAWQEVCHLYETDSKMMTLEQRDAFSSISTQLQNNTTTDHIVCKKAFVEKYNNLVQKARSYAVPVSYVFAMGSDFDGRQSAILEGIAMGRISQQKAVALLPEAKDEIMNLPMLEQQIEAVKKIEAMAGGVKLIENK